MKVTGIGRCVKVYSNRHTGSSHARSVLYITRRGMFTTYERRAVGGGWYIKDSILVPWPWNSH